MATICGEAGSLMALLCQPAEFQGSIRCPAALGVWGIDSGIRHAVTGADYGAVRVGAFMGYRVLAELAGPARSRPAIVHGHVRIDDPRWHGYLANVGSETLPPVRARASPRTLDGAAFLARYQGHDRSRDARRSRRAATRSGTPTAHPIYEHERVTEWARQLRSASRCAMRLGALMYESHASYSACGLGSAGTDRLVALAREAGVARGIYGAKITGGGSGGTVAVLGRRGRAGRASGTLRARYTEETGRDTYRVRRQLSGRGAVGAIRLDPA